MNGHGLWVENFHSAGPDSTHADASHTSACVSAIGGRMIDGWIADLSNGWKLSQDDTEGAISAWWRLRQLCSASQLNIVKLSMMINGEIVLSIDGQHAGYWHAQKMHMGQFDGDNGNDPKLHWRGIGYVDELIVTCMWIARPEAKPDLFPNVRPIINPNTGQTMVLSAQEVRFAPTESQIIWSNA